jgi:hypothetical protein
VAKSSKSRYQSQIDSETSLKFGPQLDALGLLLSQAQGDRNQALSVNASTAQGLSDAARLAKPEVDNANSAYLAQLLQAKETMGADSAGLSSSADPFKAASARDMANAQVRAAEQTRSSQGELTSRGLDARAGAVAGARAVQDRYGQQADQIGTQQSQLAGQAGSYASARLAELLGDDAKTAHETAQARADRQSREGIASADRTSRETVAAKNRDATASKPVKWATPQQTGSFKDNIESQRAWIKAHKGDYKSRAEMAADLSNGVPGASQVDMDPKSPTYGQVLKDPGVPKAKSQLALSVALDLEYDQHVSRKNIGELHKRRYKVSALGLPVKAPAKKPAPRPAPQAGLPIGPLAPVTVG